MKRCKKCNLEKSLDDFNRSSRKADGHFPQCRLCANKRRRKWKMANLDKLNAQRRKYYQQNRVRIRAVEKARRDANPEIYKRYKRENAVKWEARFLLNRAVISGKVIKLPCRECGEIKVDGHHEDYNNPLDVIWLCKKHHVEIHRKIKQTAPVSSSKTQEVSKVTLGGPKPSVGSYMR